MLRYKSKLGSQDDPGDDPAHVQWVHMHNNVAYGLCHLNFKCAKNEVSVDVRSPTPNSWLAYNVIVMVHW